MLKTCSYLNDKSFCLRCITYFRQIVITSNVSPQMLLLCFILFYGQMVSATPSHQNSGDLQLAEANDSTVIIDSNIADTNRWDALMNWNLMTIPYTGYTPETSWQFGTTGVYYFKTANSPLYSDVNFNLGYYLDTQWNVDVNSRIHFNSDLQWYLDLYLSAKNSNDTFFGVGDEINADGYAYHTNLIDIQAKPNFYITDKILITPTLRIHYEDAFNTNSADSETLNSVTGFGDICFIGIGAAVTYDTRSNFYYPNSGIFAKINATYNQPLITNGSNSMLINGDFRQYIPIYNDFIFAWNFYTEFSFGNDIPFQLMPTIGGQDILRGVRRYLYRNDYVYSLQGELRIPIWRFLKATAYAGIGDAYSYDQTTWQMPKVGYGVGLRACIHQSKTNIRFDIARQNYDNNWSFYFTVKEAF